ncbi:hypothetical protein DK846_06610 [Methanospirillum lacunae]|uniref:Tetratricopeptide repeat protein n=2 Tax=Methanospirillum lacunae TaxID=668570 RepID=A0A2V2MXJ0_9EURY|nr:hypothetical protein DK846_06610 [Methanospirillum lacunae]
MKKKVLFIIGYLISIPKICSKEHGDRTISFETAPYHMTERPLLILLVLIPILLVSSTLVCAETPTDLYKQGLAYSNQGNYEEALKVFNQAIQINSNSTLLWLNKGNTLSSLGRYQEALDAFDNVTRIDFSNKDVWYPRGVAYSGLDNYDMALHAFSKAIQYYPNNAQAYKKKGDLFMALGRYDEAILAYDEVRRIT